MTHLVEAARELGLNAEMSPGGRWVRFRGAKCTVYVLKTLWASDYLMWCDAPRERATEVFRDPLEALRAGLRHSAGQVEQ